ncbi:MAG: hypothetical protein AAGA27_08090 [Pseudomonadota bacterium]
MDISKEHHRFNMAYRSRGKLLHWDATGCPRPYPRLNAWHRPPRKKSGQKCRWEAIGYHD